MPRTKQAAKKDLKKKKSKSKTPKSKVKKDKQEGDKTRRYRPGTVALREIRKYQKSN